MSEPLIHASPLPSVDIPALPLTPYVYEHAADHPDKPALIDGPTGRTLTYAQLEDAVRRFAGGLRERGFGPGDVLAMLAPNLPEYAVVFHGVALAGGAITTINPTYNAREMAHQMKDAKPSVMVTVGPFLETAKQAAADAGIGGQVFVIGGTDDPDAEDVTALMGDPLAEQVPVDLDDVVALPYSSGTTGLSKGVVLTHRNLVSNCAQSISASELTEDESFVAALPFFHIYGMQVLMNAGLRAGNTVVTMPRFDLGEYLRLNAEHGCTRAYVAPPMVVALAKHPMVDDYDLSAMQYVMSGAAPLSAETGERAARRLGCEVVQGYGLTETGPVTHQTVPGDYRPGSVGTPSPNTECRIVDPGSGESLGVGEEGELWVRGPQMMKGYLDRPEETAATLDDDGWLHTGDIARVDEHGHFYVVDRLKELIKYKGFQVPPAELEAVLLSHDEIADAAVVGRPDEEAGELPVGFVVRTEGSQLTEEQVADFVAGEVSSYKRLREVVLVDEVPKSASGKILRRVLRDQLTAG